MLLPLLAWLIALAMLAGAAHELRRQREITDASAVLAAVPRFTLKSSALGLADYQAIQKKTAVFGTVEIVPGPSSLFIRATALSDYAAWRLTIDQVLLDNPGVSWRIDALCSGQCASGEAHKAVLLGSRMSADVEAKTEANASLGAIIHSKP
jgi:hypothetical protein